MEIIAYDCKRFDSYTSICPRKDDDTMFKLRQIPNPGKEAWFDGGVVFEEANKICSNCESFESRSKK